MEHSWYNYDTEQYEDSGTPTTDEQAKKYLPKGSPRTLYSLYREMGRSILDAMREVLERVCGAHKED